jgi:7-keto-8-aminopelargonate synthetase-like enzyme
MSASQAPALSAIAFQLAATLDAYEQDVAAMVRAPLDTEAYHRVSRHMDQMRLYAASLPPLSVAWVEVMIRHFELTHGLWRMQKDGAHKADLRQLHGHLREAVSRLSRKCVQLMPTA